MNLLCFGINFQTAPLEQREQLAFSKGEAKHLMEENATSGNEVEMVILSTCNRTEFYIATPCPLSKVVDDLIGKISTSKQITFDLSKHCYRHEGLEAARHLFEVASGLQSMVVGETEILGQTKDAYEMAKQLGSTGKYLNRLFQTSFSAAKRARTDSGITRGTVSVGSVAIELAQQIFGSIEESKVLILGAGDTGEKVARILLSKGVNSVFVSNRTYERALELAQELQGRALRWDQWEEWMTEADIIISSTAAPHHVLKKAMLQDALPRRAYRPLFLIDLAVPRDIEPSVATLDSVYLYDIDDLQSIAQSHLSEREKEISNCRLLLSDFERKFAEWLGATVTRKDPAQGMSNHPLSEEGR